MAGDIQVDAGEVFDLAQILTDAAGVAPADARSIVKRGAQNIKTDAQRRISPVVKRHAPAYPRAITYDTHETLKGAWAEIGPDKNKRQGALGNLFEFGSPTSPPHPHMGPAGEAEEPKLAKAMQDAAAKALGER
jgi:hypothetical protein